MKSKEQVKKELIKIQTEIEEKYNNLSEEDVLKELVFYLRSTIYSVKPMLSADAIYQNAVETNTIAYFLNRIENIYKL